MEQLGPGVPNFSTNLAIASFFAISALCTIGRRATLVTVSCSMLRRLRGPISLSYLMNRRSRNVEVDHRVAESN
jgi:hypothetical protein